MSGTRLFAVWVAGVNVWSLVSVDEFVYADVVATDLRIRQGSNVVVRQASDGVVDMAYA